MQQETGSQSVIRRPCDVHLHTRTTAAASLPYHALRFERLLQLPPLAHDAAYRSANVITAHAFVRLIRESHMK